MYVVSRLRHRYVLRQLRLQQGSDLTNTFLDCEIRGLNGISDPSSCRQVLHWTGEYLVFPGLVTREQPMLMPTGTGLLLGTIVQLFL